MEIKMELKKKILHLQGLNEGLTLILKEQEKPDRFMQELLEKQRKLLLQLEVLIK